MATKKQIPEYVVIEGVKYKRVVSTKRKSPNKPKAKNGLSFGEVVWFVVLVCVFIFIASKC